MRESQVKKIPFTLILGDNEKNNHSISYRLFGSNETKTLDVGQFLSLINETIKLKK